MKFYWQWLCLLTVFFSGILSGGEPRRNAVAATAGEGQVTLENVLEVWGPAWNEITAKARAGKIPGESVDAELQKAWVKALDTVIRDELFYLEARNDFERSFQRNVDQMYSAQRNSGVTRQMVENKLRGLYNKVRERQTGEMVAKNVKSAGGIDNLSRVLIKRGISFDDWKNRIIRKAYTYSYLYGLFAPLGGAVQPRPKEVMQYYRSHPDEFSEPGAVIFRHIFFSNEKHGGEEGAYTAAEEVYRKIDGGELTFAAAVRQYSEDKESAARDGLESEISADGEREGWLADVRAAAADQTPGELGPVLISPRGCHLAVLVRSDPPRLIPYSKAQKTILDKMEHAKFEKSANALYSKLKTQLAVNILMPAFPDEYSWKNTARQPRARRIGM